MTGSTTDIIGMPDASYSVPTAVLADGAYPAHPVPCGILEKAGRVICCDGAGMEFIRRGGSPEAVVGDCDSLNAEFRSRYGDIIHCDRDQESNDLTKAVRYCLSQGMGDITILGATGKREDHTIGNIGLLADYSGMEGIENVRMVTDHGVFDVIRSSARFACRPGQQVSVFCPDPSVEITTFDLAFPLHRARLTAWWQGTLNRTTGESFGIGTTGTAIIYRLFT